MPDMFIPTAEESGLIGEVGELVARKAAQDLVVWQRRHHDTDAVVAINASPENSTVPATPIASHSPPKRQGSIPTT